MAFVMNIAVWWLLSALLSLLVFPICHKVFAFLPDRGLGFSRVSGLLASSYLIWILGFVHYSFVSIVLVWIVLAYAGHRLATPEVRTFLKQHLGLAAVYELFFLFLFLSWAVVRMHHPEIVDQEKFMDFAFFNSIGRASRFPPFDPWLAGAGHYINYYYFGYFSMATFAKTTLVNPSVAYNLVIAFLFACSGQAILALGYNLTRSLWPGMAGVAFLQVFGNMDGLRQVFTRPLAEFDWWVSPTRVIHDVTKTVGGKVSYLNAWWHNLDPVFLAKNGAPADAARDACISEFPNFTFLHGDMHPHLVALPFALLALGAGLNLCKHEDRDAFTLRPFDFSKLLPLGLLALILGSMVTMNTWDLPAYGLMGSLCILAQQHSKGRLGSGWLQGWLYPSLALLAVSLVVALPFLIFFKSPVKLTSGFGYTGAKTGLRDTLVFWGSFLAIALPFLAWKIHAWKLTGGEARQAKPAARGARRNCPHCGAKVRDGKNFCAQCGNNLVDQEALAPEVLFSGEGSKPPALAASLLKLFSNPGQALGENQVLLVAGLFGLVLVALLVLAPTAGLFWLMMGLAALLLASRLDGPEGLFTVVLILMASGIIFGVEWVHLKDSFAGDPNLARMNTVFKFYFQAWILLSAAVPYALYWLARVLFKVSGEVFRTVYLVALAFVMFGAACYPFLATSQVWRTYMNSSGMSPTLNGADWLRRDYPGDYQAIMAMRKLKGNPVVAEAVGSEYTHFGRVSSYTGLPTPVGWPGHELQWRTVYPSGVQQDMETLYSTMDGSVAQALAKKYELTYVFVGALERSRYSAEQLNKFSGFMDADPTLSNNQGTVVFKARK